MKKIIDKKTIFTILITVVICFGGIVIASTIYQANAIEYTPTDSSWNVNNVSDALNELFDATNSKPVKLENVNPFKVDTGTSTYARQYSYWDISQLYSDHQNITADNIVMVIKYSYGNLRGFFHYDYDSTTGIIKAYWTNVGGYNTSDNLVVGDSWHTNSAGEEKILTFADIYILR